MKKDELKVSLCQSNLIWEDPEANRNNFGQQFEKLSEDCDLIVLPEMFTSGFTMNPSKVAETMSGETVSWLKHQAKNLNTAICGSLVIVENDTYYNRFVFVQPDGTLRTYDKRHTFNMAGEGEVYQAGTSSKLIEYRGWKIFPQICYDLRFPVFSRNTMDYDLIIYVANWPEQRVSAWDTLLKARAIENMSYCIGVNRVGKDGNDLNYVGYSAVYDPLGTFSLEKNDEKSLHPIETEMVVTSTLSRKRIQTLRNHLPFLQDRDHFTLE